LNGNAVSGGDALNRCAGETVRAAQVGILPRRELYQSDALAHAPARDHPARDASALLDITFRAGRFGAVNDLFGLLAVPRKQKRCGRR